jgi:hypothetical protein
MAQVGAVVSGTLRVTRHDGTESGIGPGDAYVIEPGDDERLVAGPGAVLGGQDGFA